MARIDFAKKEAFPTTLVVKGMLNGKEFAKEIAFDHAQGGSAGYSCHGSGPRWRSIGYKLAEDAEKNKGAIIALSKQSYVMTPFTSLLVLETEADYAKYKVDRGRNDHWAMYDCPERIAVVAEWGNRPAGKCRAGPGSVRSEGGDGDDFGAGAAEGFAKWRTFRVISRIGDRLP